MDEFIDRNPPRGCGQKEHNAFYLEGDRPGPGGRLAAWTWFLGDGIEDFIQVSKHEIPHRSPVTIDPAATLALTDFVRGGMPLEFSNDIEARYDYFLYRTRHIGSADHVGKASYTAYQFAVEVNKYGPSRRITKSDAVLFANLFREWGPVPMVFSHSVIPVFKDQKHRQELYDLAFGIMIGNITEEPWFQPSWEYESWGQYRERDQDPGWNHFMVPILMAINEIGDNYEWQKKQNYRQFTRFIDALAETVNLEQIFGASWLTRITYTLPEDDDGTARFEVKKEIPGIDILDLDEHEKEKEAYKAGTWMD